MSFELSRDLAKLRGVLAMAFEVMRRAVEALVLALELSDPSLQPFVLHQERVSR